MHTENNNAKYFCIGLALSLLTVLVLPPTAKGQAAQVECEGTSKTIKVVSVEAQQGTDAVFNFPNDGVGHFGSTPLLTTAIRIVGHERTCLVARFSTEAIPLDNHVVFQVRLDGVPMKGHAPSFILIPTPVVTDPEETDLNQQRMVSHDFFMMVAPGTHTVEVLFAGCCSGAPLPAPAYAYASGSVLTLEY